MSQITWSQVAALAPDVEDVEPEAQVLILAHVNAALNATRFGGEGSPRLTLARIYLAAHFGVGCLPGEGSAGGPVVSESALGLSRSYAAPNFAETDYKSTRHGRDYLSIVAGASGLRGPVSA